MWYEWSAIDCLSIQDGGARDQLFTTNLSSLVDHCPSHQVIFALLWFFTSLWFTIILLIPSPFLSLVYHYPSHSSLPSHSANALSTSLISLWLYFGISQILYFVLLEYRKQVWRMCKICEFDVFSVPVSDYPLFYNHLSFTINIDTYWNTIPHTRGISHSHHSNNTSLQIQYNKTSYGTISHWKVIDNWKRGIVKTVGAIPRMHIKIR